MDGPRLVPVGKIVRTHGLRGALKIFPYGETLALQKPGAKIYLCTAADTGSVGLTLAHMRTQGRHFLAQFSEIADIDAAKGIIDREVFVPEESLPPAEEGEYYHYQLIGLHVVRADGEVVGTLRGVIETGSNDVYVIDHTSGEILIPALAEFILEVDLQGGRMIIDPPEGFFDDL
jgi:16S rRNA processing protein RimM